MAPDVRPDESQGHELTNTIFALSSGAPPAAISIIRVSGPKAFDAIRLLGAEPGPARKAARSRLSWKGDLLDDALTIAFPGPASATGEDVAEFHVHGGRAVVAAVLAALGQLPGLREAAPGEFTRRAFENGRIDLAEADGLADLLMAETQSQRRAALALAGGALSRQVDEWRTQLLETSAAFEALLDFSDEEDVDEKPAFPRLVLLAEGIRAWLDRPSAERLREGVRIAIAGPPNAGKSTLFNALAGREAAITSAIAGTTRDLIEAPVAIAGTPLLLLDTAGLRASTDPVEAMGIARARDSLDHADIILWLGPADEAEDDARWIRVRAKADLGGARGDADIAVSAQTGEGMDALVDLILGRARDLLPGESEVALHARHREALAEAENWVREAATVLDPIIVAEALRQARAALDQITGRAGVEDMLDALFGRFCIGK